MTQAFGNNKDATPTSEKATDNCDQAHDHLSVLPATHQATNQALDNDTTKLADKPAQPKAEPQPITRRGGSFAGD